MGTLLLFCFKYRVGRLPFFQLEKNITLNSISAYGAHVLIFYLAYSAEREYYNRVSPDFKSLNSFTYSYCP